MDKIAKTYKFKKETIEKINEICPVVSRSSWIEWLIEKEYERVKSLKN